MAGILAGLIFLIFFKIPTHNVPDDLFSILLFTLCALDAFLPKLFWTLEKFRLSFIINGSDDAEPSDWYCTSRILSIYGCFIIGAFILALIIYYSLHP